MLLELKISILNTLQMILLFTIVFTFWTDLMEVLTTLEFGYIKRVIKYKIQKSLKTKLP